MDDVTPLFSTYRECVRDLWNDYFMPVAAPTQDWDIRDEFDGVARSIFSSLVLRPLAASDRELAPAWSAEPAPLPGFRIEPVVEQGTPILINRDLPRSGYWDHPITQIRPTDVELHLLRFFDFDQLGNRDFEFFEVVVGASSTYPEIVGRAALIQFANAKVLFFKNGSLTMRAESPR
jgi:hypothetical protein